LTRAALWASFIDLIRAYADLLDDSEMDDSDMVSFIVGMLPDPGGPTHDPAFEETFQRLLPEDEISDRRRALDVMANFVDEEMVGWWKIAAGKRIALDLRSASVRPDEAKEPVRSWIASFDARR
jgi:hypothetical protein